MLKSFHTQAQLFEGQELDISGAQTDYLDKWRNKRSEFQMITGDEPEHSTYTSIKQVRLDGILGNAKIRKAIGLSIDRDVYTDELVGRFTSAYGIVPTATILRWKYRDRWRRMMLNLRNNPEKLQELFKEGLKELDYKQMIWQYTLTYLCQGDSELQNKEQNG